MPSVDLGMKLHTVPTIAIIEETTIKIQFTILSDLGISLPKIFRWKASGRMMQMLKHATEPSRLMMRSKSGTRMAQMTKTIIINMRTVAFKIPLVIPDMPFSEVVDATALASRPMRISMVLTMGRALV